MTNEQNTLTNDAKIKFVLEWQVACYPFTATKAALTVSNQNDMPASAEDRRTS
jgi:hypothetical protein